MVGFPGIPRVSIGMNEVCAPALLADSGSVILASGLKRLRPFRPEKACTTKVLALPYRSVSSDNIR